MNNNNDKGNPLKMGNKRRTIEALVSAIVTLVAVFVLLTDFSLNCNKHFLQVYSTVFLIVLGVPSLSKWITNILYRIYEEQRQ